VSNGIRRLTTIVLGGSAALALVFALVVLFNHGLSFVGCTAATPLGWTVFVVSAVVIGAAAWTLLSQREKDPSSGSQEFRSTNCATCGRNVLVGWRLCPYCGSDSVSADHTKT
jgi:uncharacterized protein (DUF2062 family)